MNETTPAAEAVTINLGNINEGAALDAFEMALMKVLENIGDLSTIATAPRAITLRVDFKPHSDRIKVETEFSVKTTLAGIEKHKSQIFVGRSEEGQAVAFDADPRQMPLWKVPKAPESPVIQFSNGSK